MKRFILLIIIILTPLFGYTADNLDYSIDNIIRSYPLGLYSAGTIGYGKEIWGNKKDFPLYGFVRPSLTYQTSFLVNSIRGEIDINPISFIGLFAGKDFTSRQIEVPTFNCGQVICRGNLDREYVGGKFALSHKSFILTGKSKIERISMRKKIGIFADERTSLIARSGSDYITKNEILIGKYINKSVLIALLRINQSMKYYKNDSSMIYLLAKYQVVNSDWEYILGAGNFNSRYDHNHPSAIFSIKWSGKRGLLIF